MIPHLSFLFQGAGARERKPEGGVQPPQDCRLPDALLGRGRIQPAGRDPGRPQHELHRGRDAGGGRHAAGAQGAAGEQDVAAGGAQPTAGESAGQTKTDLRGNFQLSNLLLTD